MPSPRPTLLALCATAIAIAIACGSPGDATTADSVASASASTSSTTDPGTTTASADTTLATSSLGDDASDTTAAPIFDLGSPPDIGNACVPCELALMTTQSNALHTTDGEPLIAEALLDGTLVFGMREADAGRVAFSGDGNVLYREGSCPLWPYLGATGVAPPRVLCLGADWPCAGMTGGMQPLEINALHTYPGTLDYGGLTLPPMYADDPAALRADYDLVVYIAVSDLATNTWDFADGDVTTVESFVREHGGGLYLVGEYWGAMQQQHLTALNAFAAPFQVAFEQLSLAWGPAGALVDLDCFPTPAG